MTVPSELLWLTSSEHPGWHTPRRVALRGPVDGPQAERDYVLVWFEDGTGPDGQPGLIATDRFNPRWQAPTPGSPRRVAVWAYADPTGAEPFTGAPTNPNAWCTLCATEGEALEIAAAVERDLQRSGW